MLQISETALEALTRDYTQRARSMFSERLVRETGAGEFASAFVEREMARLEAAGIVQIEDQWRWVFLAWTRRLAELPPTRQAMIDHVLADTTRDPEQRIDFVERMVCPSALPSGQ